MPWITGARILLPDRVIPRGAVRWENGSIAEIRDHSKEAAPGDFDAGGLLLAPGLVDIHVHGGAGSDFLDATPEAFQKIQQFHLAAGTTSLCPTLATATYESFEASLRVRRQVDSLARLLPFHLEGPHLAPAKAGAQNSAWMYPPDQTCLDWLQARHREISQITVAPELPGALALIQAARKLGIRPSAGHTEATDGQITAAVAAGLSKVTHLFNAMSSASKINLLRVAGTTEAALVNPNLYCEIIGDGTHVSPTLFNLAYQMKGAGRLALISDALAGAGLPVGSKFQLGHLDCRVTPEFCILASGKALAGSSKRLLDGVRFAHHQIGLPLETAFRMATLTPAAAIGWDDRIGSLEAGKLADLVLLDEGWQVRRVWVNGQAVGPAVSH